MRRPAGFAAVLVCALLGGCGVGGATGEVTPGDVGGDGADERPDAAEVAEVAEVADSGEPDASRDGPEHEPVTDGTDPADADPPDLPVDGAEEASDVLRETTDVPEEAADDPGEGADVPEGAVEVLDGAMDVAHEATDAPREAAEILEDATDLFPEATDAPADTPADILTDPGPPVDTDGDGLFDADELARGTDRNDPDTDKDGQLDGGEVADGTDPLDPSSAMAWHPEWTERPRLFFGPGDVDTMKARTAAASGPHATQWAHIRRAADAALPTYPPGPYDQMVAIALGSVAESAALRGLLAGDPAYTAKALAAIATDFPDPSGLPAESDFDLREAETLIPMCIAFDLAAGTPGVDPVALATARANLVRRIDTYRWMGHEGSVTFLLLSTRNNHVMKFFAALGLCALALNDRSEAATDLSEAMTGLDWMMNGHMSTPDGAWGEGWSYLVYGSRSYVPFFAAYHRWAKGRTLPYFGVPNLQPSDTPHTGRVASIADFAVNARTRAVFERALWSLQPDGRTPNTDDANPEVLPGGMLAWLFDEPRFLWAWFMPSAGFPDQGPPTAAFALYDGGLPPLDLGTPLEGSLAEAGFAIFRSSWSTDATYLVLQGENGSARRADPGHEHPDELSFLLWHGGRPLIVDPGYINFANHDRVNRAEDHNGILVDGQGAPIQLLGGHPSSVGVDAFLSPMETAGRVTWTSVRTAFRDVDFARRVARVDGRIFVVEDRMDGRGAAHDYMLLLNGGGGGEVPDSDFEMLADGARWRNGPAWVEAHVQPVDGEVLREHDLEEDCAAWGTWRMHERLKVSAIQGAPAGFLSVVVPGISGQEAPVLAMARPAKGVAVAFWQDGDTVVVAGSNQTAASCDWDGHGGVLTFPPGLTIRLQTASGAVEEHLLAP